MCNKAKLTLLEKKAISNGFRVGMTLTLWTSAYVALEEALDRTLRHFTQLQEGRRTLAGGAAGGSLAYFVLQFCAYAFFLLYSVVPVYTNMDAEYRSFSEV
jgi:hypothetical protein